MDDPYLNTLIEDCACANTCDYCGRHGTTAIAAEAAVVVEAVYNTVRTCYCEPAAGGVPCDGGFIIEPIDIAEVLYNLDFGGHPDFFGAVVDAEANDDYFVPAAEGHRAGVHTHEVLSSAWQLFSATVKHETRFHFANTPREAMSPYDIDIADVLPAIAKHLRPFIRTLPVGTEVYRARGRRRGQTWAPLQIKWGHHPKKS